MSIRVSTAMQYNMGTRNIQNQQYELQRVQNQLSTGKRMLVPADDPIAAMSVVQVGQAQAVNQQYLDNQEAARTSLSMLESSLGSFGDQLLSIRTSLVAAGNPTYDPSQREMVVKELEQRLQSLVDMANTQDAEGNYVFAGFQSDQRPFQYDAAANQYVYQGDQGQVSLQVSPSIKMAIKENGSDVFMRVRDEQGNLSTNVFQSVRDAIDELKSPTFSTTALSANLKQVDSAMDHLSMARASVGARLNGLESLTTTGEAMDLQHATQLSNLQDLDYAEAISRFSRFQTQLQATQISFKQVNDLSLFNLL